MHLTSRPPQDGPVQLALITGDLPDGTCLRILAELTTRRGRPLGVITQTRHMPVPGASGRYRQDGSARMQYSGKRLALIPEHLRQLETELAEEGADTNTHGLDHQRLAAYLHELAGTPA